MNSLRPKFACKAKNPATCPYHSAFIKLDAAAATGDYKAYEEAKNTVIALQSNMRTHKANETPKPVKAPTYKWDDGRRGLIMLSHYYFQNKTQNTRTAIESERVLLQSNSSEEAQATFETIRKEYSETSYKEDQKALINGSRVDDGLQSRYMVQMLKHISRNPQITKLEVIEKITSDQKEAKASFDSQWGSKDPLIREKAHSTPAKSREGLETAAVYNSSIKLLKLLNEK